MLTAGSGSGIYARHPNQLLHQPALRRAHQAVGRQHAQHDNAVLCGAIPALAAMTSPVSDCDCLQATTVGLEELEDFGSLEEERPLPPHHLDEQSPDKAYVLGELVGEAEGALITQEILRATSDTAYREGEFTSLKVGGCPLRAPCFLL